MIRPSPNGPTMRIPTAPCSFCLAALLLGATLPGQATPKIPGHDELKRTASGLQYAVLKPGKDAKDRARSGDSVKLKGNCLTKQNWRRCGRGDAR